MRIPNLTLKIHTIRSLFCDNLNDLCLGDAFSAKTEHRASISGLDVSNQMHIHQTNTLSRLLFGSDFIIMFLNT